MDVGSSLRRNAWLTAVVVTAGLGVTSAVVWQSAGDSESPGLLEPTEPAEQPVFVGDDGFEWIIEEPQVDVSLLAGIHAASRLQYDECQQDFAALTGESSSSRRPLYFC